MPTPNPYTIPAPAELIKPLDEQMQRAHSMIGKKYPVTFVQRLQLIAKVKVSFADASTAHRRDIEAEAINRAFLFWVQTGERVPPVRFVNQMEEEIREKLKTMQAAQDA